MRITIDIDDNKNNTIEPGADRILMTIKKIVEDWEMSDCTESMEHMEDIKNVLKVLGEKEAEDE